MKQRCQNWNPESRSMPKQNTNSNHNIELSTTKPFTRKIGNDQHARSMRAYVSKKRNTHNAVLPATLAVSSDSFPQIYILVEGIAAGGHEFCLFGPQMSTPASIIQLKQEEIGYPESQNLCRVLRLITKQIHTHNKHIDKHKHTWKWSEYQ